MTVSDEEESETTVSDEESATTRCTTTLIPRVFSHPGVLGDLTNLRIIKLMLSLFSSLCRTLRSLGFLVLLHVDLLVERVKMVVLTVDSNGDVADVACRGVELAGEFSSSRPRQGVSGGVYGQNA